MVSKVRNFMQKKFTLSWNRPENKLRVSILPPRCKVWALVLTRYVRTFQTHMRKVIKRCARKVFNWVHFSFFRLHDPFQISFLLERSIVVTFLFEICFKLVTSNNFWRRTSESFPEITSKGRYIMTMSYLKTLSFTRYTVNRYFRQTFRRYFASSIWNSNYSNICEIVFWLWLFEKVSQIIVFILPKIYFLGKAFRYFENIW